MHLLCRPQVEDESVDEFFRERFGYVAVAMLMWWWCGFCLRVVSVLICNCMRCVDP